MRLSSGVEWALHCCGILAVLKPGEALSASALAEFHALPPAFLAKVLSDLASARVLEAVEGRTGGYRLARRPAMITLLDIVEAVEGTRPAFRCTEIRRQGSCAVRSGYTRVCGIAAAMHEAEDAWRSTLSTRTLADIVQGFAVDVPHAMRSKVSRWLEDSVHKGQEAR
jgi:Rrf2 family protein